MRTACRRFGVAVGNADLHTDLVNEDHQRLGLLDGTRELTKSLAHQTGLKAGKRLTHIAFDFTARRECSHRVDHHQINRTGTHQRVRDFQSLFAGVGLRQQQIVKLDT